ncbi:hypothetical protein THRCLA_20957 [Thraustotheca clavata]|uniref:Uncharacterized protein n=1 Tax=Thraustotheca clavata TaxID=74557 RepID=A0A1W0A1K2_9STRA|nr:hypothetical protein THRCLA_20957 [Thraustotheca clavata]
MRTTNELAILDQKPQITIVNDGDLALNVKMINEQAVIYFHHEDFNLAIKKYNDVKLWITRFYTSSKDAKKFLLAAYTNLALAHIKLEMYDEAINLCNQALKINPKHVKALLRKALAYSFQENHSIAKEILSQAFILEPKNKTVRKALHQVCHTLNLCPKNDQIYAHY